MCLSWDSLRFSSIRSMLRLILRIEMLLEQLLLLLELLLLLLLKKLIISMARGSLMIIVLIKMRCVRLMFHLSLHLPLLRAVFWRPDDNRVGDRRQGLFDFGFIQAVGMSEHAGRRQSQEIRTSNEFRHRRVKDRDQMRIVDRRHFIMPPALGHERNLTGRYREVQQFFRKRIDKGDDGRAGNDIYQLRCILMDMRLHYVSGTEIYIQQGSVAERVQFFYG